jgi:hypothetical protein
MKLDEAGTFLFGAILSVVVGAVSLAILIAGKRAAARSSRQAAAK